MYHILNLIKTRPPLVNKLKSSRQINYFAKKNTNTIHDQLDVKT